MENLNVWRLTEENIELTREVQASFDRLSAEGVPGYRLNLGFNYRFEPVEDYHEHFVIGSSIVAPLGFASCYLAPPGPKIGDMSFAIDEFHYIGDEVLGNNGQVITPENVHLYEPYSEYTGQGGLMFISLIETLKRGQGIGSKLINYLKSLDYELIELEPVNEKAKTFFELNGFVDTALKVDGRVPIMTWNNPKYKI